MHQRTLAIVGVVIFLSGLFGGVALEKFDVGFSSSDEPSFSIEVDNDVGVNQYTLIEIDEGDNDEEVQITWVYHEFLFTSTGGGDSTTWDFGDGTTGTGDTVTHQYQSSGIFTVTATSISSEAISTSLLEVTVNRISVAEVDNMECACAPTGKDTVIDLVTIPGLQSLEGFVKVEHDGSSESCSLRNPLQECHLRVILQRLDQGQVVSETVLFDDTFRTDEKVVDFDIINNAYSQGETMQLRLETDQLRDWHKPTAHWNLVTY